MLTLSLQNVLKDRDKPFLDQLLVFSNLVQITQCHLDIPQLLAHDGLVSILTLEVGQTSELLDASGHDLKVFGAWWMRDRLEDSSRRDRGVEDVSIL